MLLALEARVQNCCGLAQASAKGLRMITETMTFGNHFISFEEAFHLYSSYFASNADEVAFRDKLLHQERGLNVLIVTHPTTLKRYVVMNNIDTESFLNEYTMEYLSKEGNENERKLDQSTVSSLIESMDTEHDRGVVRAIIALLHTRSEILNLGIVQHLHGKNSTGNRHR